jgi:hypothetical protein
MKIKILMMFKNEDELLVPWVAYHSALVGPENLLIFDNGSTSKKTLDAIAHVTETYGVKIDGSRSAPEDFINKGEIFRYAIQGLDANDPADFYFPLDCDEFLAVQDNREVWCTREKLHEELEKHRDSALPLKIYAGLDNNPFHPGYFKWSIGQLKTFFTKGTCKYLDHGYHGGVTFAGRDPTPTGVVYLHYHYKPYALFVEHSKAKLLPYTNDFSTEAMQKYAAESRTGHHNARQILTTEAEYSTMFPLANYVRPASFQDALSRLFLPLPFDEGAGYAAHDRIDNLIMAACADQAAPTAVR